MALVMLALMSRVQALTVQDRVIRLEMRLRLRGLLPPDLQPSIDALTHRQLVALRFASDAEMAGARARRAGRQAGHAEGHQDADQELAGDWLRA